MREREREKGGGGVCGTNVYLHDAKNSKTVQDNWITLKMQKTMKFV